MWRNDRPVAAPILMMCFGYDLDTTLYEVWIAVCLYVSWFLGPVSD